MTGYRRQNRNVTRQPDGRAWHCSQQSVVVHSGTQMNGLNRWSVQLLRGLYGYDAASARTKYTLFVAIGPIRFEIGSR